VKTYTFVCGSLYQVGDNCLCQSIVTDVHILYWLIIYYRYDQFRHSQLPAVSDELPDFTDTNIRADSLMTTSIALFAFVY